MKARIHTDVHPDGWARVGAVSCRCGHSWNHAWPADPAERFPFDCPKCGHQMALIAPDDD